MVANRRQNSSDKWWDIGLGAYNQQRSPGICIRSYFIYKRSDSNLLIRIDKFTDDTKLGHKAGDYINPDTI